MIKDVLLDNFKAKHDYLVCIDSDGCAFDTMEIKHKECFCPATIDNWGLQPISTLARETWEFVNLYSTTRGCSRFNAVLRVLDLLSKRKDVVERGFTVPDHEVFRNWVETTPIMNNDNLSTHVGENPQFGRALEWSLDMNRRVAKMVHGIPPFPFVRESLMRFSSFADVVIVSATPREALEREWSENDLLQYVSALGAQENGTKSEILERVRKGYDPDKCIMLGDAPGDLKAAEKNGILFYPIRPLDEIPSWKEFYETIIDKFAACEYQGKEMDFQIERFHKCLPQEPSWEQI